MGIFPTSHTDRRSWFGSRISAMSDSIASAFGNVFTGAADSGTRTSVVFMPTDSRREINNFTRMELVKKSRWLFNNLGLFRRVIKGVTRYTVGAGLSPVPETRDSEWNKRATEYFENWAMNQILCDVAGRQNFYQMQKTAVMAMLKDGEFFAVQTSSADDIDPVTGEKILGRPQLQWLETQHIANLRNFSDVDQDGFREGIHVNSVNRPIEYRCLVDRDPQARDMSESRVIPAASMIHLYEIERANQLRGLPWAYHGLNSAIDMLDLNSLEKAAVKLHSTMAGVIRKRVGDAGRSGFTGDLKRRSVPSSSGDGKQKVVAFENFAGGAAILQLGLDEEFNLFTSARPSSTWIGFMDYLVRDIAYGFGVSPEFIWSVSGLGGANTRFILEDSKWFFEEIQDLLIDVFCQRVYVWVIARAMKRNELPSCGDPYWWKARWQRPPKVTVDQGREGNLEIERLRNGMTTWDDYYGSRGKAWDKVLAQRVEELKTVMDMCEASGVPFEYIFSIKPGTPSAANFTDSIDSTDLRESADSLESGDTTQ
jgi:lambda family phage portal protein